MNNESEIIMVNDDIGSSPVYKINEPYSFEYFKNGNEFEWIKIHELADDFNRVNSDLFNGQLSKYKDQLDSRQIYLKNQSGRFLGTSTAWDDPEGKFPGYGMIHWIAVIPEFQKKGLGRILLSETIRIIKRLGYTKAFLSTDSRRVAAVRLYRSFGFRET